MLVMVIRTLILYTLVIVSMRIMGKRQIGQLQPYELAIAIMISELASLPMQNTGIPLLNGAIPIITLLIAQITISLVAIKSVRARGIICGRPSILIEDGRINEHNLRTEMYTINDLLEQLRIKDVANINDVQFAILETNGQLSVFPKTEKRPVTPLDMILPTKKDNIPIDIIIDGRLMHANLNKSGHDVVWLNTQLNNNGFGSIKNILFATIDSQGNFFAQSKDKAVE